MSPRDSTDRSGAGRRAKPDVYTTMLGIAAIAIVIAIVLLVLEWGTYDYDTSADLRDSGREHVTTTYLAATAPASTDRASTFDATKPARSKGHRFTVRVA